MTGNVPLVEPEPQQLHLSDESDEEEEEYEEEEYEEETVEDDPRPTVMPTMTSSHSMTMNSPQNQAGTVYQLTAEQLDWLDKQSPKETRAPRLLHGIISDWKVFRAAHTIYKEEQKGTQSMVELISIKARQGLLVHLEMTTAKFKKLTDAQVTKLLDDHFQLGQISNYKEILTKCHMPVAKNSAIDINKIQLYVEDFIDQLCQNPHFQRDKLRGATPKIINEIFTDGLTPPVFRAIVKDLGTTKIARTIQMLPDIYSESEIYMKWKQRSDDTDNEQILDIAKEGSTKSRGTYSHRQCTHCLSSHPTIARSHTDATCYFLHPELRTEKEEKGGYTEREHERARRDKDLQKAKVAHVSLKTDRAKDDAIRALEEQLAFLTCTLKVQDKEDLYEEDD